MPQATLYNPKTKDRKAVEVNSPEAKQLFSQGYQLETSYDPTTKESQYDGMNKKLEQEENILGRSLTEAEIAKMYPEYSSQYGHQGLGNLTNSYNTMQTAGQNVQNMGNPRTGMNVLQEAIKTKNKVYDQGIGESEIFKKAGVGGMGALMQSLSARGGEIQSDYVRFQNILNSTAGMMQDQISNTLNAYKIAANEYDQEMNRISKIDESLRNQKQALELLNRKQEIDNELSNNDILSIYKDFENADEIINSLQSDSGMRTDRHNNPTAFTTDIAKQAGLVEGTDYEKGDPFTTPGGTVLHTARLLGDPIETTIKVIDKIGLKTQSGKNRWDYLDTLGITQDKWDNASDEEKVKMVGQMYKAEGGGGSALGSVAPVKKEDLTATEKKEKQLEEDKQIARDEIQAVLGEDGFADPTKVKDLRQRIADQSPEALKWFDTAYPPMTVLNPEYYWISSETKWTDEIEEIAPEDRNSEDSGFNLFRPGSWFK